MVILSLTEKGGESKQLSFQKTEVTVGRVQNNDVVLPKGNVSKRHCRIFLQDGHFSIEDLKSTNGTYVNGRKITEPTAVSTADKIYVGDFVIRVENATPAEVPTPPPPANEAGALSSALPRRPPPPPPPARPGAGGLSLDLDEAPPMNLAPPPPPPRGASRAMSSVLDEADMPPPPAPSDIDLDDDVLGGQPPRLNVPPLKPVLSLDEEDSRSSEELPTATRNRSTLPPAAMPILADYPEWLRTVLEEGAAAVYIAAPNAVEIERDGRRSAVTLSADQQTSLEGNLRSLAARATPAPDRGASVVDVLLPDGSRLAAVFPPLAEQVAAALRRPLTAQKSLADLSNDGALSKEIEEVLEACSTARRNVLVTGDRRATDLLLRALAATIPVGSRTVVMADRLATPRGTTGWIQLSVDRHSADAVTAVVALRPDYLIAEITSVAMAADLVQECALGQEGTFAALGGRSAHDVLGRLQALAAHTLGASARDIVAGGFDLVVHVATLPDGGVRVMELAEPKVDSDGRLVAAPLIAWRPHQGRGGGGAFQAGGGPSRLAETLAARGVQPPPRALAH